MSPKRSVRRRQWAVEDALGKQDLRSRVTVASCPWAWLAAADTPPGALHTHSLNTVHRHHPQHSPSPRRCMSLPECQLSLTGAFSSAEVRRKTLNTNRGKTKTLSQETYPPYSLIHWAAPHEPLHDLTQEGREGRSPTQGFFQSRQAPSIRSLLPMGSILITVMQRAQSPQGLGNCPGHRPERTCGQYFRKPAF